MSVSVIHSAHCDLLNSFAHLISLLSWTGQDLAAVQKAGADAVSVTIVSHGEGAEEWIWRECKRASASGFEVTHPSEPPASFWIAQ